MPNDREMSELISSSLSQNLPTAQEQVIRDGVAASNESRRFEPISRRIQGSLSDVARRSAEGDPEVSLGLSDEARERLPDSARQEQSRIHRVEEKTVVPSDSTLRRSNSETGIEPEGAENRQLTSHFRIQRPLGAGAQENVWLARNEKLKRSVALKEMNTEAAGFPRAWQRFFREAETTGYLERPNVVRLYQFGTDPVTGRPFYTIRFAGKRTLAEAIEEYHDRRVAREETSMDLHKLLTAFLVVCRAVTYAHSRGVIHRDLKPENVALDSFGQVVVLDWRLARITRSMPHPWTWFPVCLYSLSCF